MLDAFRYDKVVVGVVVAGRNGRGKYDTVDSGGEPCGEEFLGCHVPVAAYKPWSAAHLQLVLEVIEDNSINGASSSFAVFEVG